MYPDGSVTDVSELCQTGLKNELTATYKVTLDEKGTIMTGSWHLSAPESKNGKFQARKH